MPYSYIYIRQRHERRSTVAAAAFSPPGASVTADLLTTCGHFPRKIDALLMFARVKKSQACI